MGQEALDLFGQLIMREVRDHSIADWDMILDGRAKDEEAKQVHKELESLNPQAQQLIHRLIPAIVDTTLHHFLWALDQSKSVDIAVRTDEEYVPSLSDISDGLEGELYFWVPKYSLQRFEKGNYNQP